MRCSKVGKRRVCRLTSLLCQPGAGSIRQPSQDLLSRAADDVDGFMGRLLSSTRRHNLQEGEQVEGEEEEEDKGAELGDEACVLSQLTQQQHTVATAALCRAAARVAAAYHRMLLPPTQLDALDLHIHSLLTLTLIYTTHTAVLRSNFPGATWTHPLLVGATQRLMQQFLSVLCLSCVHIQHPGLRHSCCRVPKRPNKAIRALPTHITDNRVRKPSTCSSRASSSLWVVCGIEVTQQSSPRSCKRHERLLFKCLTQIFSPVEGIRHDTLCPSNNSTTTLPTTNLNECLIRWVAIRRRKIKAVYMITH